MLTEEEIRKTNARAARVTGPWLIAVFVMMLAYMGAVATLGHAPLAWMTVRWGESARDWGSILMMLPVLPMTLAGIAFIDWQARSFRTFCPACGQQIVPLFFERLVALRRCPHCREQVVEGRPRSEAAFTRYTHRRGLRYLRVILWIFPGAALIFLAIGIFDREWTVGGGLMALMGVLWAGYPWLRTWDRHYLWPCLASLLAVGLAYLSF